MDDVISIDTPLDEENGMEAACEDNDIPLVIIEISDDLMHAIHRC